MDRFGDVFSGVLFEVGVIFDIIFDPHSVTSVQMALEKHSYLPTVAVATASPEKFGNVISPLIDSFSDSAIDENEEYLTLSNENAKIIQAIKAFI